MTVDAATQPKRSRVRIILIVLAALIVVLLALGCYLAYLAMKAKNELEVARSAAGTARSAVLSGDDATARSAAATATAKANSANSRTHNPVWSVAAAIPWAGSPLKSVQQMTDVVAGLAGQVLEPTAALTNTLNLKTLRSGNSSINVVQLATNQPKIADIAKSASAINNDAAEVHTSWLGYVNKARTQLLDQTEKTATFSNGVNIAAQIAPGMLGAYGPRAYFLGFQTPAEARQTGGLLGGFGVIDADNGRVTVRDIAPNTELEAPSRPLDFGPDYNAVYGWSRPYIDYRNSNISPHFPYAAQIWMSMWEQQSGDKLNGAIAIDPIALQYILEATGPVTLPDGERITADNVVPITLSTSYVRFAKDNNARKAYLTSIAQAVVKAITSGQGGTKNVLNALGKAVSQNRISIYSSNPNEQGLLVQAGLAHEVPQTDQPFMGVYVSNLGGNKLDYYLKRDITYSGGGCDGKTRDTTVTVKLTNTISNVDLPHYVVGASGNPNAHLAPGENLVGLQVDATRGAVLNSVTVDGQSAFYTEGTELGHPLSLLPVRIAPGKTVTVVYHFTEPTAKGKPLVPIQPLVDDPNIKVTLPECK